jgi:hypothetical protein
MRASLLGIAFCTLLGATNADAATIFFQDFEAGLGANESTGGNFVPNNTGFGNNGTTMMGHAAPYAPDEYSFYQVVLDLTGVSNTFLTFDFAAEMEQHFDQFNVQAGIGGINPPADTLYPAPISDMQYTFDIFEHHPNLGNYYYDTSSGAFGVAAFDLSLFDGLADVYIRFQFGSDVSINRGGFNMDNVLVTGDVEDPNPTPVPEPASVLLLGAGLAMAIAARRGRVAIPTAKVASRSWPTTAAQA